ncbi:MAG TPA: nucleoside recognition domain-containing protein [Prolixibacteraceae bacterium]|jgi:spore maturation protein SpmA/spore maturation protein SpmB|nr:nucleoside recognition domain-containing protein [Prolixibacteraceae bacterium]
MILNYIWICFFLIAFVVALAKLIFFQDVTVFSALVTSTFDAAKTGFEVSLGMTGVLTFWMGIMKVGEKGGVVQALSRAIGPFFQRLFPELGRNHPAYGAITMNIAANMLNLDNAATPMGLQAMKEMQASNPSKDTASNAQIMFMVLNASGLTIIPVTIMVYRAQLGAANPTDVFIPILIATFCSTLAGLIAVSVYQRINLLDKVILSWLGGMLAVMIGIIWYFASLEGDQVQVVSNLLSGIILVSVIIGFILMAMLRKVNVYESFIEGAQEGFSTAVKIIPYLIAILVAIAMFRASGAMDYFIAGVKWCFDVLHINTDFVDALPTALMKPLSGSGARGMMIDAMKTHGADSFVGRLASTFQGSADTTFYILAVYFGSVGIKKTRHALACSLIADLVGFIAAIFVAYFFFH